jgi:hypothetical protein
MQQARIEWKKFHTAEHSVEGRMIRPEHESGDLVLFCPGFPGGGATIYEQRHSETITKENFSQIIIRHNGTILNGEYSDAMLNKRQFPNVLPHHREHNYLGAKLPTIEDWLLEPQTVLEDIGCNYTNIYIYAHSFGAVAALHSIANLNEINHPVIARIKTCICMAPALGTLEGSETENIMRVWQDGYTVSEMITGRVVFDERNNLKTSMRNIYQELPERISKLSGKLSIVMLHVAQDEYIREKDIRDFCKESGHEDSFMLDEIDRYIPTHGGMDAHDMPVYPTELLLELIEPMTGLIDLNGLKT